MRRAVMETDIDANLWPPRRRGSNRRARPGWRRRGRGSRGRGGPGRRSRRRRPAGPARRPGRPGPARGSAAAAGSGPERLWPVAERGQAPAVQLPLGQPRPPRQLRDHPRPVRPVGQPAADGDGDRVDGRGVGEAPADRVLQHRDPVGRGADPAGQHRRVRPELGQRHPQVAQCGRGQPEHGRRRAGPEPHRRDLDPGRQLGAGRDRVRTGDDQLAIDPHQVEAAVRQHGPGPAGPPRPGAAQVPDQVGRRRMFRVHAGDAAGGHRQSRAG